MRISTNTIFDRGLARMTELQTELAKTQQQVSTGRRILTPSDDPVAAARALEVTNSQEINAQFATNRRNAMDTLSSTEGALHSVTSLLQDIKALIVNAGNGALDNTQRGYIATELQGQFDELLGLANSRDGVGNYIFAGYQSTTQPFTATANGAQYAGDQGVQKLQVNTGRQMEVTQNGNALFEKINSTGTFVSAIDSSNGGSGVISSGKIIDSAVLTGHSYEIEFTGAAAFNVYDLTNDPGKTTPLPASGAYVSGDPIQFDGLQFEITGAPNAGDQFTVTPTSSQSIFATLKNLITTLQTPASDATTNRNLAYGLGIASTNVDNALDQVLTARADTGANLKEIESLDSLGEDLNLQYAQSLSDLRDLDYVQAITNLMKQQNALQAAQQSFVKVSGLSLFNYLS